MTYEPADVQLHALKLALKHKRYGIFFQQRIGKTKVALDYMGILNTAYDLKRVLVISPLSARTVWEEQAEEHLRIPYTLQMFPKTLRQRENVYKHYAPIVNRKKQENLDRLSIIVINYEMLRSASEWLLKMKFDIIIYDESHLIKNPKSTRSIYSYRLGKDVKYKLLLTGTPYPKRPTDIFGQFRVMNKDIFGIYFSDFKDKYCIMGGYQGKEVIGYTNVEDLSDVVNKHSIRALRRDIMAEPDIEHVDVKFDLSPKARKYYSALRDTYVTQLSTGERVTSDRALSNLTKLHQLCGGFLKDDEGDVFHIHDNKFDVLKDLVNTHLEGDESVVIFYRYVAEGDRLKEIFGSKAVEYRGKTTEKEKVRNREAFRLKKVPIILVQMSAGSTAINLADNCRVNIYFSLSYSLVDLQQSRDRIMGRAQMSDSVTNYYIMARDTVDEKIVKTLKNDEDLTSMVGDKYRWLIEED